MLDFFYSISKQGTKIWGGGVREGGYKDRVLKGIKTNWHKQRNIGKLVGRRGGQANFFQGYQLIVVNIQSRVACKNKPKLPHLSQS